MGRFNNEITLISYLTKILRYNSFCSSNYNKLENVSASAFPSEARFQIVNDPFQTNRGARFL